MELPKTLGMNQLQMDEKITKSILGGYLNSAGITTLKSILAGNKAQIAKELFEYSKNYVQTAAFKKEYFALKNSNKPTEYSIQTPEDLQKTTIDTYKKSVESAEKLVKSANTQTKPIFENVLKESQKMLDDAKDPNNKIFGNYLKSYPEMVKISKASFENELKLWDEKFPTDAQLFVKQRLIRFLNETKDIDFSAKLIAKNNKMVFEKPEHERKSYNWKMAFRAGKEVVDPARVFVNKWVVEIGN
jgi:hypothetical protein